MLAFGCFDEIQQRSTSFFQGHLSKKSSHPFEETYQLGGCRVCSLLLRDLDPKPLGISNYEKTFLGPTTLARLSQRLNIGRSKQWFFRDSIQQVRDI